MRSFHCVLAVLFLLHLSSSVVFVLGGSNSTISPNGDAVWNSTSICLTDAVPFVLSSACPPGWYCPFYNASDPSTYPAQCAPTDACILDRLETKFCNRQGKFEPTLCPPGFYCPTPTEKIECPEDYYCPIGQFKPRACDSLSKCNKGASKNFEFASFIAVIIIDICLAAFYYLTTASIRRINKKREEKYAEFKLTSINPSLHAKGEMFDHLSPQAKMLCQGFRRAQQQLPPMHLQFNELSLTIPGVNGKKDLTILKGVTGSIEPGKVTAIMGPSGAGKTTFLNTMLGKLDPTWKKNGLVNVNGVEEQLGRFRKIIGYVPQEDVMHRDLTVYENIAYSARTRLPKEWTSEQVETHINSVIGGIGLAHVQNSPIGDELTRGISGGQRKRVNIGMEIAAAPSLLLLDEPTSGLDSTAAMSVCQLLTDLARVSQLTVAMVIHQPRVEIWNQLDELLLLAPGGLTVYQGPQKLSTLYFALRLDIHLKPQDNPADALLDAVAEQAKEFVESWKKGGREYVDQLKKLYGHLETEEIIEKLFDPQFPDQHFARIAQEELAANGNEHGAAEAAAEAGSGTHDKLSQAPVYFHTDPDPDKTHDTVSSPNFHHDEYELQNIKVISSPSASPVAASTTLSNSIQIQSVKHDSTTTGLVVPAAAAASYSPKGTVAAISPHRPFPQGSLRTNASFFSQMWNSFVRSLLKQYKNMGSLFLEVALALVAGGYMGALSKMSYQGAFHAPFTLLSPSTIEDLIPQVCFNLALGVALAAASAGVNVFGEEKAIRHRELSSGHSLHAYYIGVSFAQTFRQFIDAIHFAWLFHIFGEPITTFAELLPFMFLLYIAIYNIAAVVSMIVQRKNATLLGVVISLIICSMNYRNDVVPEGIQIFSPTRWMSEALFDRETRVYTHVMQVSSTAYRLGYSTGRFDKDVIFCFLVGNLYRLIAWILMVIVDRKVVA